MILTCRPALTVLVAVVFATSIPCAVQADLIDVLGNNGVPSGTDAPETVINQTDRLGTTDLPSGGERGIENLLDQSVSGMPFVQVSRAASSREYWNSPNLADARGDVGILIDLGGLYNLDAIQLYGYNISDPRGGGIDWGRRSPGSFEILTATVSAAVSTTGDKLLVSDISLFTQHGTTFGMSDPGRSNTNGETYLFGGATQPSDVIGTTHDVTMDTVVARYVFLRDLRPIDTDPADANIVGMAEMQFFGARVPEPASGSLATIGLFLGSLLLQRKRRRRSQGDV